MAGNLLDAIARSNDVGWLTTCLNHNIKTGNMSAVEAVRQRLAELNHGKPQAGDDPRQRMSAVEQALAIWPVLADLANSAEFAAKAKITYGNLVLAIGYPDKKAARSIRRALGLIGWYCLQHSLPTLNSLVVNQGTKEAGESVVLHNGLTPDEERRNVVNFDWRNVQPPTASALRTIAVRRARTASP